MNGNCSSVRSSGESSRRYFSRSSDANELCADLALEIAEPSFELLARLPAFAEHGHDHRLRQAGRR